MFRNLTLIQIADELKLSNDYMLKRQFTPGPRGGDRPFIEWINHNLSDQRQVIYIIDTLIQRILKSQEGINPETTLPNLLKLRECIGCPTKTAVDFLSTPNVQFPETATALAQAADTALALSPNSLFQEYCRSNAIAPCKIPLYKMTASTNPTPTLAIPKEQVGQAINALIADVRNFHHLELARTPGAVKLANKACFLLSDNESELATQGKFGKSSEVIPQAVALLVGEYLADPKLLELKQVPETVKLAEEARFLLSSKESVLATQGIFGKSSSAIMPNDLALMIGEYLTGPKSVS